MVSFISSLFSRNLYTGASSRDKCYRTVTYMYSKLRSVRISLVATMGPLIASFRSRAPELDLVHFANSGQRYRLVLNSTQNLCVFGVVSPYRLHTKLLPHNKDRGNKTIARGLFVSTLYTPLNFDPLHRRQQQ